MVTFILFLLGFFLATGAFGSSLIGGFSFVLYWLIFIAVIITIFSTGIIYGSKYFKNKLNEHLSNKVLKNVPLFFGWTIAAYLVLYSYTLVGLSWFIVTHIPPDANSWFDLPSSTRYAIVAFIVMWFISTLKRKS